MTPREELELILTLIKKHSLPLSPILEYAIKEKMEQYVDTVKGIELAIETLNEVYDNYDKKKERNKSNG